MRLMAIAVLVGLCAGCTLQKHHEPMDEALRARVEAALVSSMTAVGVDMATVPERTMVKQTFLLANHARNAEPAFAAIAEDRISDDQLRGIANYAISEFNHKSPDEKPPTLLTYLVKSDSELSRGERELLLGLINQLCADRKLVLPNRHTRRFLNHAVSEDEPGLTR